MNNCTIYIYRVQKLVYWLVGPIPCGPVLPIGPGGPGGPVIVASEIAWQEDTSKSDSEIKKQL